MSIRLMSQAWEADLPDSEKLALLALADWSNDSGECWPSIAQLTKKCSKSARTIQGAIQRLCAAGHLTRTEKPGKGCEYRVHPRSHCTPAEAAPPQGTADTPAAAAPNTSVHTKPQKASPSSVARAKPKPRSKQRFDLPNWVPAEPWAAFVEMRRDTGHKLTDRAKVLAIGELERLRDAGNDPAAVLNQSTMKAWRGLFEVKGGSAAKVSGSKGPSIAGGELFSRMEAGEISTDEFHAERARIERARRAQPIGKLAAAIAAQVAP